jgi:hypothetical protein
MMASNYYAIYNFDGKRIAKQVPRVAGAIEMFEADEEALYEMFDIMDEFEDTYFEESLSKPIRDLSANDFYIISKAVDLMTDILTINGYLEDALFFERYSDNFERVVCEADDDFSDNMADIWLE